MKHGKMETAARLAPIAGMLLLGSSGQTGRASCPTPQFHARHFFQTGAKPYSVAIADINGDSKPDIVTANYYDYTVSVLLGNGDGTYMTKADYWTGNTPASVAIADMNGDGKQDILTANSLYSGTVSVLLGNGDGIFKMNVDFPTGHEPKSVLITDVNVDGKADIAAGNSSGVSILLGNGDGTFKPKIDYEVGLNLHSIAIADLNADGNPDLVTAIDNNGYPNPIGTVTVSFGNGDGTFGEKTNYGTGMFPNFVKIADVNGDGKPEIITANSNANTVSILLGNGDGTFKTKVDYIARQRPVAADVADVNGDNFIDIVTANENSFVSVLLGNGDGTFRAGVDMDAGNSSLSVAVADVNGDGKPDIVAAIWGDSTVAEMLNVCTDFTPPLTTTDATKALQEAAGLLPPSAADVARYDLTFDHVLTIEDAVRIAQKVNGR